MNEYRFSASLRITHPTFDSKKIAECLQIEPSVSRNAGDARVSPSGRLLQGTWHETYVGFELVVLPDDDITTLLEREIGNLQSQKNAFQHITDTGGKARCYILATPLDSTFGEEIPWEVLRDLSEIRLSLCLEVYRNE